MYHDETLFNDSASFPFMEVTTNYPYGPTYAPLMGAAPTVGPGSRAKQDDSTSVFNHHPVSPAKSEIPRNNTSTAAYISAHIASDGS
ncbi:hypothetical protein N7527_005846 [Penicillium freii]|nr:hypothetical protein N7527_005846 [Penicillium freii]